MTPQLIETKTPTWFVDVRFRGRSNLIACAVLKTNHGLTLIDPGPTTTLPVLEAALVSLGGLSAVKNIILTHIHLDHAGGVGQLAEMIPGVNVFVHPVGERHLINPERLIQSAQRIYGDQMDELWGAIRPVSNGQVYAVDDDTVIELGGRSLRSCYTPGHASHHMSLIDENERLIYAGDAAGMRIQGADYIIPVAPPPDIDLNLWEQSLMRLEQHKANRLFLTHFGVIDSAREHIKAMRQRLHSWGDVVLRSLNDDSKSDILHAEEFHDSEMIQMRSKTKESFQEPYNYMGQPRESWVGLARYWRKKNAQITPK
ncbi:MAG: MBL fold metallo-hydrolase [Bacteroidetes bacterium]|nr:MBL fold metallo-hydrolase [Bacteroidota bacterium]